MRAFCLAVFLAANLRADTYKVSRVTTGHSVITTYEWAHNGSARIQQTGNVRNRQFMIWNDDRKTAYIIDPSAEEYIEPPKMGLLASLARWIAPPKNQGTGKTVDIYHETIDTGQRRQILGYTARYLRVRERHVAASGACDQSSLRENEGWYIAFSEREPGSVFQEISEDPAYNYTGSYGCQDNVRQHGDPLSPGLLVYRKEEDYTLEVIALSTARLDASLFRAPSIYKKVDHFKGGTPFTRTYVLSLEFGQLQDAIGRWFYDRFYW